MSVPAQHQSARNETSSLTSACPLAILAYLAIPRTTRVPPDWRRLSSTTSIALCRWWASSKALGTPIESFKHFPYSSRSSVERYPTRLGQLHWSAKPVPARVLSRAACSTNPDWRSVMMGLVARTLCTSTLRQDPAKKRRSSLMRITIPMSRFGRI